MLAASDSPAGSVFTKTTGSPTQSAPRVRIRPNSGWAGLSLGELWDFRDLLIVLGGRDLKLRYRQTLFGVAWVLFQPLLGAGIFALVFGSVAKLPSNGTPYLFLSYVGLMGWGAFSNTLIRTSASLIGNTQLISKVYFPRLILPLSSVISVLLDFGVAASFMVLLMWLYHIAPHARLFLMPVWLSLLILIGLGLGLLGGALAVRYRDVQHMLPIIVPFLMYASPVGYSIAAVPSRFRLVFALNPLSGLFEALRWSVIGVDPLDVPAVAYSAIVAGGLFLTGTFVFRLLERDFADVI